MTPLGLTRTLLSRAFIKSYSPFSRALSTQTSTPIATSPARSPIPQSTAQALELIRSEPNHYVIASFLGRKFILSPRDILTVPRIKDVAVGDVVSFSAISEAGSRTYTLRGNPILPKGVVRVQGTVVEHTKGKLEKIEKFKRRKGYHRTIQHKQTYTRLRIGPVEIAPSGEDNLTTPP